MSEFRLKYQIVADAARAKAEIRSFDDVLRGVGGGLGSAFAGPAGIAAAGVAAVGAAAVTTGIALFNLTKNAAEFGSEIFDASKKTGLGAEALSAMKFAADQSGTSLEAITGGIAKFSKTVGEAADGSAKAAAKLKDFGITPQEAIGDLDGALGKVFKRIIDAPPGIERMTLAQKAFGRSGADLLPFLDSFDGDLGKLIRKAKELGVTIDDDAARAADEFGDQLDTLNAQLAGVGRTIGTAFMPVFTDMARATSEWAVRNKDEINNWARGTAWGFETIATKIKDAAEELWKFRAIQQLLGIGQFVSETLTGLSIEEIQRQGRERGRSGGSQRFGGEAGARFYFGDNSSNGTSPGGGGGSGRTRRPPREGDSEFRRFFEERGFGVNRTYGRAINAGSLHPSGMAADVSIKGRSVAEVFALTAAALEKGYRLFDERQKRSGVKQTGPHLHFERGGSLNKESGFLGAGMYGGADQLAYLKQLDAERLGKATGQAGFNDFARKQVEDAADFERELADALRDAAGDMIAAEEQASDQRLAIRQKEADQTVKIIEGMVLTGEITEIESIRRLGQLKIDMLEDERAELKAQIPTAKNLHRLEEIRLELGTQRTENTNEELKYWKAITDEINKQISALEKRNSRRTLKTRTGPGEGDGFLDTLYNSTGKVKDLGDVWQQVGQQATGAFLQMGQGLGAMLESWVLLGDQADVSMKKMVGAVLAGVASQAATLAIFHLAMGIAALTPWGAAMYGPAPLHFKAAAVWGAIAVGTALAGRAVSGSSNQSGGGRGSSSSSSNVGGGRAENLRPISRETDDVYISGRRPHDVAVAKAIDKLTKKIESMRPGDVLVAGARQKKGFVADQFARDVKSNSALGTRALRSMGGR